MLTKPKTFFAKGIDTEFKDDLRGFRITHHYSVLERYADRYIEFKAEALLYAQPEHVDTIRGEILGVRGLLQSLEQVLKDNDRPDRAHRGRDTRADLYGTGFTPAS